MAATIDDAEDDVAKEEAVNAVADVEEVAMVEVDSIEAVGESRADANDPLEAVNGGDCCDIDLLFHDGGDVIELLYAILSGEYERLVASIVEYANDEDVE